MKLLIGHDLPPLPYESCRSVMARFGWRNGIHTGRFVQIFAKQERDPKHRLPEGLSYHDLDHYEVVRKWLSNLNPERDFRKMHFGDVGAFKWTDRNFRFCPICLEECYHSYLYQWTRLPACPLHGCEFATACLHCGKSFTDSSLDASIGDVGYRCFYCKRPIAGGEPNLGLHLQLQSNQNNMADTMRQPAKDFEELFNRLTFLCSPAQTLVTQGNGSVRKWGRIDHILFSAERIVAGSPLLKGTTESVGMTFLQWHIKYDELRIDQQIERWKNYHVKPSPNFMLTYAATRRQMARWLFCGKDLESEDRRLCILLDAWGHRTVVGDWNRLELTYLIFRMSVERGDLKPVCSGKPVILRSPPRSLDQWSNYGALPRIAYRAWLLCAFAVIYAYLGMRGHMTIDEVLMVPSFPESLTPTFVSSPVGANCISGGVYFPTIEGMPLRPFMPSREPTR